MKTISEGYINLLIEGPWDNEDPYEILGVKKGATPKEVADAHKKLARKHHPDVGGSDESMQKLNDAKDRILNPKPKFGQKPEADIAGSKYDKEARIHGYRDYEHRREENSRGNFSDSEHVDARNAGYENAEHHFQRKEHGFNTKAGSFNLNMDDIWDGVDSDKKGFEDVHQYRHAKYHGFDNYNEYKKAYAEGFENYKSRMNKEKFKGNPFKGNPFKKNSIKKTSFVGASVVAAGLGAYAYSKYKKKRDAEEKEKQEKYQRNVDDFNKGKLKKAAHKRNN